VRGAWELIIACKGSVVVAWRRGRLRVGLAGVLAAMAVVAAVGGLWLLAGDLAGDRTGDDAAAPIDDRVMPDHRDADGGAAGSRATVPARRQLHGSRGPGSAEAAGGWPADDRAPGPSAKLGAERSGALGANGDAGTNGSSVRTSGTTTAGPNRGGSPSPSIPATTAPVPSVPPDGTTTTTTGAEAPPPDDDSGAGGLGGLLGGVLEVLRLG
jgi:hypothetical protein